MIYNPDNATSANEASRQVLKSCGTPLLALAQAEERKDRQDHHDQTDEVDQSIHVGLPEIVPSRNPNGRKRKTFLSSVGLTRLGPIVPEPPTRTTSAMTTRARRGFSSTDWPVHAASHRPGREL